MGQKYNIMIMGASYGSLLGTKLALAGHNVKLACLPAEVELIDGGTSAMELLDGPAKGINPLWEPPWPSIAGGRPGVTVPAADAWGQGPAGCSPSSGSISAGRGSRWITARPSRFSGVCCWGEVMKSLISLVRPWLDYLGGIADDHDALSSHLRSRADAGRQPSKPRIDHRPQPERLPAPVGGQRRGHA